MNQLAQLYHQLQACILHDDETITLAVDDTVGQAPNETKLKIYKDNYFLQLIEVLSSTYEMTKEYLAEPYFNLVATNYIQQHPSRAFSVNHYGHDFSDFLAQQGSTSIQAELAKFEWALEATLLAVDANPLTLARLQTQPPEAWAALIFHLHPSCQMLTFQHQIGALWEVLLGSTESAQPPSEEGPFHYIFWRHQQNANYLLLSNRDHWILQQCLDNQPFSSICEGLCQWLAPEAVAPFAGKRLIEWTQKGLFRDNL